MTAYRGGACAACAAGSYVAPVAYRYNYLSRRRRRIPTGRRRRLSLLSPRGCVDSGTTYADDISSPKACLSAAKALGLTPASANAVAATPESTGPSGCVLNYETNTVSFRATSGTPGECAPPYECICRPLCVPAPSGTYVEAGAVSYTGTPCSAGSGGTLGSPNGASQCTECAAGKATPIAGQTCVACDPGRFASGAGATACERCPTGTFPALSSEPWVNGDERTGATVCESCPSGKFSQCCLPSDTDASIGCPTLSIACASVGRREALLEAPGGGSCIGDAPPSPISFLAPPQPGFFLVLFGTPILLFAFTLLYKRQRATNKRAAIMVKVVGMVAFDCVLLALWATLVYEPLFGPQASQLPWKTFCAGQRVPSGPYRCVIAVGQSATGVFAIGQIATGVFVPFCMMGFGLFFGGGMMGASLLWFGGAMMGATAGYAQTKAAVFCTGGKGHVKLSAMLQELNVTCGGRKAQDLRVTSSISLGPITGNSSSAPSTMYVAAGTPSSSSVQSVAQVMLRREAPAPSAPPMEAPMALAQEVPMAGIVEPQMVGLVQPEDSRGGGGWFSKVKGDK